MRTLFIVVIALAYISSYAQTSIDIKDIDKSVFRHMDSLGIDADSRLNDFESNYLNTVFSKRNKNFDFRNKTIAFVTGSSGKTISNKQRYFSEEKQRITNNSSFNGGSVFLFNEKEKIESGGYDAAIIYWSKGLPTKKRLIKKLKNKNSKAILPSIS